MEKFVYFNIFDLLGNLRIQNLTVSCGLNRSKHVANQRIPPLSPTLSNTLASRQMSSFSPQSNELAQNGPLKVVALTILSGKY